MGLAADLLFIVLEALWLMLPAYLSNMLPVFVGGGAPIDGGRMWKDGRPILGKGKTWRGVLLAPLAATVLVAGLRWLVMSTAWGDVADWSVWGPSPWWFLIAYSLGFGALVGDAVKSFFKRRTGRQSGDKWVGPDQLDFVAGGLLFVLVTASLLALAGAVVPNFFFAEFTWPRLLVIVLLTPALHLLVNIIGYKIGAKDVPW